MVVAELGRLNSTGSLALYPDSSCSELRARLAQVFETMPEQVLLGNGSEDLLAIAAHTLLAPGDEVLTVMPSFGLHVIYPQSVGAKVVTVAMKANLQFDVDALIAAVSPRTRMVIISNPSNPVGSALNKDEMTRLLAAISPQTLVIWDEAYYEYAVGEEGYPDSLALLQASGLPWLLLRTFSKAYGLAALRIGYGLASDAEIADMMNRVRTPFNINRFAQRAAMIALEDQHHVAACAREVRVERARVFDALVGLGYRPAKSYANFLFFDCKENATALAERMLSDGVIVKPWREQGYQTCMRVSIGAPADNDLFLASIARQRKK